MLSKAFEIAFENIVGSVKRVDGKYQPTKQQAELISSMCQPLEQAVSCGFDDLRTIGLMLEVFEGEELPDGTTKQIGYLLQNKVDETLVSTETLAKAQYITEGGAK